MAKKNKRVKTPTGKGKKNKPKKEEAAASTLDEIEAMSSSDEGSVEQKNTAWNTKADALKKMIQGGAYDKMLDQEDAADDDSVEEVVLGDNDDKDDESTEEDQHEEDAEHAAESEEEEEKEADGVTGKASNSDDDEASSDNESDNEEDEEQKKLDALYDANSKALRAKTEELLAEKKDFPWVETFDVVSSTPLPFGTTDEETGQKIDVHDDLKREVAFYDVAMEAVETARMECKKMNVPFTRPDDFFAEMVKSDDHMARIKDRLIYENKKIEAVSQRKSNREQKLRSKEAHSNKIAEKSKRKKDNIKAVDDWAQSAKTNRGGRYNDQDDQQQLSKLQGGGQKRAWTDRDGSLQTGPNKKRQGLDKKYGFGGKRGRFKQNSKSEINDMSSFNPKGQGVGAKRKSGGGAAAAGAGRQGKRARDAGRSRQRS